MKVGLTGGIASGKSAVADAFALRGVPVIDTDLIARELVEPGTPALEAITAKFGTAVLDNTGNLDRKHLRKLVFSDPAKRRSLESLLHPLIVHEMHARAAAATGPYQIIVVPLLVEVGLSANFDRVLVVDCPERLQLSRLLARDAETEQSARAILATQSERGRRLGHADDIIVNDGDLVALDTAVAKLHRVYTELAH